MRILIPRYIALYDAAQVLIEAAMVFEL